MGRIRIDLSNYSNAANYFSFHARRLYSEAPVTANDLRGSCHSPAFGQVRSVAAGEIPQVETAWITYERPSTDFERMQQACPTHGPATANHR
jgi:hypothetical protein